MWLVTHQKSGVSALGLQRVLGLGSYRTAWSCLHKLRRAMIRPGRQALSGDVEVDETFVGGREKGGGRRHIGKKSLVMIAAEVRGTGIGRIRLQPIPDQSKEHLMGFVQQAVTLGSTVITDGLPVYVNVARLGYIHRPRVPKSKEDAHVVLPRVHRVAALLKRWLLGIHHGSFSKRQLAHYLDEFAFRFNRRLSPDRGMLFYRLVQQALAVDPAPIDKLKKGI
jgi:transposase-like protein